MKNGHLPKARVFNMHCSIGIIHLHESVLLSAWLKPGSLGHAWSDRLMCHRAAGSVR